MKLEQHIIKISEELENYSENKQRKRYLESHLEELLKYQKNNPIDAEAPTALELYCHLNPSALECRIYDD
jgi:hypothetical protein